MAELKRHKRYIAVESFWYTSIFQARQEGYYITSNFKSVFIPLKKNKIDLDYFTNERSSLTSTLHEAIVSETYYFHTSKQPNEVKIWHELFRPVRSLPWRLRPEMELISFSQHCSHDPPGCKSPSPRRRLPEGLWSDVFSSITSPNHRLPSLPQSAILCWWEKAFGAHRGMFVILYYYFPVYLL